jgi:MarR family transcriptional regulator, temperature-dependent positive regulator of motility
MRNTKLENSVLHLLHRAGQQAEVVFTEEGNGNDLTPRQFAVLLTVEANEDISQTGLVDTTGIDRSTLADVVRRLVLKGLLARKRTKEDARMYAVRLTTKGQKLLDLYRPTAQRADQRILALLDTRERARFIELLDTIVKGMDRMGKGRMDLAA